MNDEILRIQQMVAEGKISAEESVELLESVGRPAPAGNGAAGVNLGDLAAAEAAHRKQLLWHRAALALALVGVFVCFKLYAGELKQGRRLEERIGTLEATIESMTAERDKAEKLRNAAASELGQANAALLRQLLEKEVELAMKILDGKKESFKDADFRVPDPDAPQKFDAAWRSGEVSADVLPKALADVTKRIDGLQTRLDNRQKGVPFITTRCANNLKQLATAVRLGTAVNTNLMPEDLDMLVEMHMLKSLPHCPHRDGKTLDYFYFPGELTDKGNRIMLCDLYPHAADGNSRCVAYTQGSVEVLSPKEFQKRLAEPRNKAFAEAFATEVAPQKGNSAGSTSD